MSIIKNNREVPRKNYYIVIVVSILVIVLTIYIRNMYLTYQYSVSNSSIFNDKTIYQINSDNFDFALSEITEGIIYVGFNDSSKVKNMEKKLFREISKNNLNDLIIYWDITNIDKKIVSEKLMLEGEDVVAPMLVYVKNGEVVEIVDSKDKMIDNDSLEYLLTKYGII
ncbi:MAG: hypothetical protein IKR57_04560 [Bacilli bacterium]|nr:hypothetical protein [Bacilli bacterium]